MLLGVDRAHGPGKDVRVIHEAYNDAAGRAARPAPRLQSYHLRVSGDGSQEFSVCGECLLNGEYRQLSALVFVSTSDTLALEKEGKLDRKEMTLAGLSEPWVKEWFESEDISKRPEFNLDFTSLTDLRRDAPR